MNSSYTIVITTHNRPELLDRAVASALEQTVTPLEVLVVDDGSTPPVSVWYGERVRVIRLEGSRGVAAARNAGLAAAKGHWVTFLDDDDLLLPQLAERSLDALASADLPPPVAALSGLKVVDAEGVVVEVRIPPTLPRGHHFALEDVPPGKSFLSKQTLFVETGVLRGLGGWDEAFRSRSPSELFLRLNPVCSLIGVAEVTYVQFRHRDTRLSTTPALRDPSFQQLVAKHRPLFRAHPRGYARLLIEHARTLRRHGRRIDAARALLNAACVAPGEILQSFLARRVRASSRSS